MLSGLLSIGCLAQVKDSTSSEQASLLLKKMDSTHRADSLRRLELLHEIENLKGSGANKQREQLLKQFNERKALDSVKRVQQQEALAKLKASAQGFPVAPFGDTLFTVYTRVGSFTPADRAKAISEKIEKLYDDVSFSPDSLIVNQSEAAPQLVYKDMIVMSINEMEAMWFGVSQQTLAIANQQKFRKQYARNVKPTA